MEVQAMTAWLTAFGDAWEQGDADAAAALFAPGATFQPSPFGELVRGRRGIAAHWAEVMSGQQAVRFQGEVLGVGTTYGIAQWRAVI
jgi:ketosteroid isomerase-like protein